MPWTCWPDVEMNWGIPTGWGWERSWGSVAMGAELVGKRWDATVVLDGVATVPAIKKFHKYRKYIRINKYIRTETWINHENSLELNSDTHELFYPL